jgi:hypothetical protein
MGYVGSEGQWGEPRGDFMWMFVQLGQERKKGGGGHEL